MMRNLGRLPILLLILAPTLAAMLAPPAAAQNAMPALRADVTVTGDIVRIGDLVENSGPVADIPIFRAPDLGTRGAVPTERVIEAIRPHQLIGIDTRGLSEVVVTRASRVISVQDISARIAKALEGQYGLGEARNIQVDFEGDVRPLNVEPSVTGDLQVASLTYYPRGARFEVTFDLPTSAALRWQRTRFSGVAYETVDAVTIDHPIERGEVLKLSELRIERRPKAEGPFIGDVKTAGGMAARHQLRPGVPLRDGDLMKPAIIAHNDPVTLVYEAPGLTLTLRGQAQEAGAMGDTVSVLNLQSKRVVQGVITGPGRVTVASTTTRYVASEPAPQSQPPAPE
jgi:flagellar basal body P-ring formation protein FlgA